MTKDENHCCVIDPNLTRCPAPARFWVGSKSMPYEYTEVCGDHVEEVLGVDDVVVKLYANT